ncbi:nucleoid-associated protein [Zunongwangia atlantica]|uniref:Nucleoid-associated protein NdpA n=1 Tax=Zunongwangia atlantica 22II14-10F7 TaxID=1185767 RepID=A0A1Y1SXZ8_9FLAO|nr:nucleoid-associated protein [Zunongwangia atlantica]ORL43618.1 nucleoid-associated protein NdpA [Zunongwangia atlantica 22II14-10F7]
MIIKNIVLHQIKRESNEEPKLNCSDHLLNTADQTVIDFVDKLIKSFRSKRPTYGTFQDDKKAYPFQTMVEKYQDGGSFLSFSKEAMVLLKKEIKVPSAKGGYVVFTHYENNRSDFLITIMLDKSEQFSIDDNSLDLKKLLTLDIEKLARANRLNFHKWQNKEDLYLSFIKGTRSVSNYFQKFIGNTDLTSSKENSKNLKNALGKYMRDNGYSDERKEAVNRGINEYFVKQYKDESDIQLDTIAAYVNKDDPNNFIDFVEDNEDFNVSGSFRVKLKSDFDVFHKSIVKGSGYKLEFEKKLIKDGKILREGNNVIIRDVPDEILDSEFED